MKNNHDPISKWCSIFSMVFVAVFLISGTAFLYFKLPVLDTIAGIGLTGMFFPLLVTIVTLTAGVDGPFIESDEERPGIWNWVFYLIIFPFVCLWIFTGVDSLFDIIPSPQLLRRSYDKEEALLYSGALYLLLITAGFIWRTIRSVRKKAVA